VVFDAGAGVIDDDAARLFGDFDIEILRTVDGGMAPHHRSPTSAMKPAGQDLRASSAPGIADSTAPIATERQSFLDNIVAQFART
jgi:hypothetical protein